jgi:hemoglobin-like flavoprotein
MGCGGSSPVAAYTVNEGSAIEKVGQPQTISSAPLPRANLRFREVTWEALPRWASATPILSTTMYQLLTSSWEDAIEGHTRVMTYDVDSSISGDIERVLSVNTKNDTSRIGGLRPLHTKKAGTNGPASNEAPNPIGSIESNAPSSGAPNGSKKPLKSRRVQFYETFLSTWNKLDPIAGLVFKSTKDAIDVISRMIAFFVNDGHLLNKATVGTKIRTIAIAHRHHGIQMASLDAAAQCLFITMKRMLGTKYTASIHEAWANAFSKFFLLCLPLHRRTKVVEMHIMTAEEAATA